MICRQISVVYIVDPYIQATLRRPFVNHLLPLCLYLLNFTNLNGKCLSFSSVMHLLCNIVSKTSFPGSERRYYRYIFAKATANVSYYRLNMY